jgi:hypothetical protein
MAERNHPDPPKTVSNPIISFSVAVSRQKVNSAKNEQNVCPGVTGVDEDPLLEHSFREVDVTRIRVRASEKRRLHEQRKSL